MPSSLSESISGFGNRGLGSLRNIQRKIRKKILVGLGRLSETDITSQCSSANILVSRITIFANIEPDLLKAVSQVQYMELYYTFCRDKNKQKNTMLHDYNNYFDHVYYMDMYLTMSLTIFVFAFAGFSCLRRHRLDRTHVLGLGVPLS